MKYFCSMRYKLYLTYYLTYYVHKNTILGACDQQSRARDVNSSADEYFLLGIRLRGNNVVMDYWHKIWRAQESYGQWYDQGE
jgi:hypothetical protein